MRRFATIPSKFRSRTSSNSANSDITPIASEVKCVTDISNPGPVRKIAREAVIFLLIGMVVGSTLAVSVHFKRSRQSAKLDAAKSIHAQLLSYANLPQSKIPPHTVAVPFSDGAVAYVVDCAQMIAAAKGDVFDKTAKESELGIPSQAPPSGTILRRCVYFSNAFFDKFGGVISAVSMGSQEQRAIEATYRNKYEEEKWWGENYFATATGGALIGALTSLFLWMLYRLVYFAIKG
jgi:hypothetical protein